MAMLDDNVRCIEYLFSLPAQPGTEFPILPSHIKFRIKPPELY